MAKPSLYLDRFGNPVQALSPQNAAAQVAIGAASARIALPVDSDSGVAEVVRLAANQSCYFRFGDVTVVAAAATDHLFPPGSELFETPAGATHIAVIQDGAVTGKMTITRME